MKKSLYIQLQFYHSKKTNQNQPKGEIHRAKCVRVSYLKLPWSSGMHYPPGIDVWPDAWSIAKPGSSPQPWVSIVSFGSLWHIAHTADFQFPTPPEGLSNAVRFQFLWRLELIGHYSKARLIHHIVRPSSGQSLQAETLLLGGHSRAQRSHPNS